MRLVLPGSAFCRRFSWQASLGFRPTEIEWHIQANYLPFMEITSYKTVYQLESLFSILPSKLPPSKMISVCSSYSLTSLPLAGIKQGPEKLLSSADLP